MKPKLRKKINTKRTYPITFPIFICESGDTNIW